MTLTRCPNGHYYDSSRFGNKCPHCGAAGADLTTGDQPTMPLNQPTAANIAADSMASGDVTVPLTEPIAPVVAEPVAQPLAAAPVMPVEPAQPEEKTVAVTADMLDGVVGKAEPTVGWLVCVEGVNKGQDYRLHQGRNFIGRAPSMDVYIKDDNTVSRSSHAVVVYDPRGNAYLAQPGDAKELFYINDGLVLNTTELKAMDRLSLGNTVLMFVPLCGEDFHW